MLLNKQPLIANLRQFHKVTFPKPAFRLPKIAGRSALFLLLFVSLSVSAQNSFTRHVQTPKEGKGTVVIVQDEEISKLVDSKKPPVKASTPNNAAKKPVNETKKTSEDIGKTNKATEKPNGENGSSNPEGEEAKKPRTTHYTNVRQRFSGYGYRVQIFTGGNSRNDKAKAQRMGELCRSRFPELSVYTHFVSPRWICRVGDFRDAAAAQKYVSLIRGANISNEARVVKCKVFLPK